MIDPKNQIIIVKGKVVKFDNLPLHLQEKLLITWKIKKDGNTEKSNKTSENSTEKRESEQIRRKKTGKSGKV